MNITPLTSAASALNASQLHLSSSPANVLPLNASLLIAEVHARRPIWDKKHELHNQRDLIEALWNEISVIVGVPGELLHLTSYGNRVFWVRSRYKKTAARHCHELLTPRVADVASWRSLTLASETGSLERFIYLFWNTRTTFDLLHIYLN